MEEINRATQELVAAIKGSEIYKQYLNEKEKLQDFPRLKDGIDEYRKKNFELQNSQDVDNLFERVDEFEREYEDFRENPFVNDFLAAELSICRLIQEVYVSITEAINFDMELTGGL